jgi:undecaprenyl pyrophosphate synthase
MKAALIGIDKNYKFTDRSNELKVKIHQLGKIETSTKHMRENIRKREKESKAESKAAVAS